MMPFIEFLLRAEVKFVLNAIIYGGRVCSILFIMMYIGLISNEQYEEIHFGWCYLVGAAFAYAKLISDKKSNESDLMKRWASSYEKLQRMKNRLTQMLNELDEQMESNKINEWTYCTNAKWIANQWADLEKAELELFDIRTSIMCRLQ